MVAWLTTPRADRRISGRARQVLRHSRPAARRSGHGDQRRRYPPALPREDRPHHARLDGAVRRAARRRRAPSLEINKVALDAVGITLADVEGKPFWTTFWWQVSRGDQPGHPRRDRPRGEGRVRPLGHADLRPRRRHGDDHHRRLADAGDGRRRQGRVHLRRRARHHREEGAGARDRAEEHRAAGPARAHPRARRDQDAVLRQRQPRAAHAARADPRPGAAADRRRRDDEPGAAARGRRRSSRATRGCCSSTSTICSTCRRSRRAS